VDDFEHVLVDFQVVGSFFANRTLPLTHDLPAVDVGHDEASQVEGLVVQPAVLRPHGNRYLIGVELALEMNLYLLDRALLYHLPIDVLAQPALGLLDCEDALAHGLLDLVGRLGLHCCYYDEMAGIVVLTHALHVLVLLLDDEGALGGQQLFVENDFLVNSAADRGGGVEGLELVEFFVVEVQGAMLGPGDLVLVFLVEADAPGLDGVALDELLIERQINSILNFVFLCLAQIAAKEDLSHPPLG
jgi:hypothetical protein